MPLIRNAWGREVQRRQDETIVELTLYVIGAAIAGPALAFGLMLDEHLKKKTIFNKISIGLMVLVAAAAIVAYAMFAALPVMAALSLPLSPLGGGIVAFFLLPFNIAGYLGALTGGLMLGIQNLYHKKTKHHSVDSDQPVQDQDHGGHASGRNLQPASAPMIMTVNVSDDHGGYKKMSASDYVNRPKK